MGGELFPVGIEVKILSVKGSKPPQLCTVLRDVINDHFKPSIVTGADPVGGARGAMAPTALAMCPRFWTKCSLNLGKNALICIKVPHESGQNAPPPFVTKVP